MDEPAVILVVEDEKKLNEMVRDYLSALGYGTVPAFDGMEALRLLEAKEPDLVVLDVMLPGIDGFDVIRKIRERSNVPVIMLTARAAESDKLIGFELGIDDYLTKPFSMKELAARIRTILRRAGDRGRYGGSGVVRLSGLVLDPEKRTVTRNGEAVSLTSVQFDILALLMRYPGKVFTRQDVLNAVRNITFEGYERTIDVHIKNLRKALEPDPSDPRYILTVWGVGYKFTGENQE